MEPKTRREHFLAKIAGNPYDSTILPKTREEFFLNDIAESGGDGGSSLVEELTAVLLPPTTLTFERPRETFYVKATAEVDASSEPSFEPTGARVIVDGGEPQEVVLNTNYGEMIGDQSSDWVISMTNVEEDGEIVAISLDIRNHGFNFSSYSGEHTVSIQVYRIEPTDTIRTAVSTILDERGGGYMRVNLTYTANNEYTADVTAETLKYHILNGGYAELFTSSGEVYQLRSFNTSKMMFASPMSNGDGTGATYQKMLYITVWVSQNLWVTNN